MNISEITLRLDRTIRFFLYVLILSLPYSKGMVETSVVTCSLLWIIKHALFFWQKRLRQERGQNFFVDFGQAFCPAENILNPGIVLFLLAGVISISASPLPLQSLHGFFTKTMEWFVVYLLGVEIFVARRHIDIVLWLLVLTAAITGIDVLIQTYVTHKDIFFQNLLVEGYRATAAFGHPNILGAFLALAIPTVLGLFLSELQDQRKKILLGISFPILCWSLFLTFSRGAWMGTVIGLLFFMVVTFFQRVRLWLRCVLVFGAIITAVFVIDQAFVIRQDHNLVKNDTATVAFRIALWREGILLIKERPFFGHGLNTFMFVMEKALIKTQNPLAIGYSASYAHNCYLQIAVEVGILGLSAFCGILFLLFKQVLSLGPAEFINEPGLRFPVIGILCGLLSFLVHSAVDVNFYSIQLPVLFWFMAGLLISLDKQLRNKTKCVIKGQR